MSTVERLPPLGIRQRGPLPSGSRLVLVRHAESRANAEGLAGGALGDGGLTERGRAQARALAERLARTGELAEAVALYSSTLPRAIETAEIIAGSLGLARAERADLVELGVGEADGLSWEEVTRVYDVPDWDVDPGVPCAPGGESLLGFHARCSGAIDALVDAHPEGLVVVVTHGGFIEQALKRYQGLGAHHRLRPRVEHCSMTEIEYLAGRERLMRYNDQTPL